jgi:hypothetical protein
MDLTLKCQDCGNEFIWTQDDQEFYRRKNLSAPKHCLICRAKHKAQLRDPGRLAKKSQNQ